MVQISKTRTTNHFEKDNIWKGYLVWKKVIGLPPFLNQPPILPTLPFYGKNLNSPFLEKFWKPNLPPSL